MPADHQQLTAPIFGDTAIRHSGTRHEHMGPCQPDCWHEMKRLLDAARAEADNLAHNLVICQGDLNEARTELTYLRSQGSAMEAAHNYAAEWFNRLDRFSDRVKAREALGAALAAAEQRGREAGWREACEESTALCDAESAYRRERMEGNDPNLAPDPMVQGHKSVTAGALAHKIRALAERGPQ